MKTVLGIALTLVIVCWGAGAQDSADVGHRIANAARLQIGVTTSYDPSYVALSYPGGDVPISTGVCSDVVIRAVRGVGLDLQQAVHEDMARDFEAYPNKWNLRKPDRNIDHRRVPNLMRYFERNHVRLSEKLRIAVSYAPGDLVVWDIGGGVLHIGIVSDRRTKQIPLIIHNIGQGVKEEDVLFSFRVVAHYRIKEQEGSRPNRPNKSLQPTATAVMPPAAQEIMPAVAVAEH